MKDQKHFLMDIEDPRDKIDRHTYALQGSFKLASR